MGLLVNTQSGVTIDFYFGQCFMSDDQNSVVTLKVRVTPQFREKIIETAKANSRSMNAEIVSRLEQSFDHTPINNQDLAETIKQLNERILELSRESREMRMLYIEALNSKLNK